ncbi:MAG: hypothetical protein K8T91_03245 [Planctomycetes bacterium]|nr:hypothetical protein [Planctomycetota bacterium]
MDAITKKWRGPLDDIHRKIEIVAISPSAISSPWARAADVEKILTQDPKTFGLAEFQMVLMGKFEESLFFLPYTMDFMLSDRSNGPDLTNIVFGFLKSYETEIRNHDLWLDITQGMSTIFFHWIDSFAAERVTNAQPPFDVWVEASVYGHAARDGFLNALLENSIMSSDERLLDEILRAWAARSSHKASSAHLLDTFLHVRRGSYLPLEVYSYSPLIEYATNLQLCQLHWNIARDLVESQCPIEYQEAIVTHLLA